MSRIEKVLAQATKERNGYRLWDDYAVEAETAALLYALVRHQKPRLIVEDGTGQGISTVFLAEAAEANGVGEVVSFEDHEFFAAAAAAALEGLPVEVRHGSSQGTDLRPELVFIDGVSDLREAVIEYWLTHPDRPLVVVHDARRSYPFHLAEGVHLPGNDGVWVGRAKPPSE